MAGALGGRHSPVTMDTEVRPAADALDQRAAIAVNNRAWRATYDDVLPAAALGDLSTPDLETLRAADVEMPYALARDGGTFLVADAGDPDAGVDGVVGYAGVLWERTRPYVPDDAAELRAVYVDPDHQGGGVGSALLAAAIDAVPDGPAAVRLHVFPGNDPARSFYEARGFREVGTGTFEFDGATYDTVEYERPL
jgi:ribosomal protein S18 acetylase RimI-like enzyme